MNTKNKNIKFLSYFLIILIIVPAILFSSPRKANALLGVEDTVEPGTVWAPVVADEAAAIDDIDGTINWEADTIQTQVVPPLVTIASATSAHAALAAHNTVKKTSHSIIVQILIAMGHMVLQKLTQSTVNWINSGFHGSPLFVQNPTAFLANIGKSEIIQLVNMTGYNTNNYPFGKQWDMNIINRYKNAANSDMVYSLNQVMQDHPNYLKSFNSGGWSAFFVSTQYPQNNPVGYDMMATQALARKLGGTVQNVAQKAQTVLSQGMGFLSPTTCPDSINKNYNNGINEFNPPKFDPASFDANYTKPVSEGGMGGTIPDCADTTGKTCKITNAAAAQSYNDAYSAAQNQFASTNLCQKADGSSGLVATTPGAVAAHQIMTKLDSGGRMGEFDAAIGNSISAILNALMNHFMQKGLSALSGAVSSMPDLNSWSYAGETLSNSTSSSATSTANTLVAPQSVTVQPGTTTSGANISGGTAPYSIQTQPDATIATAQIDSNNNLTVTGVGSGQTSFIIQDSSNPVQTATVQVATSLVVDFSQLNLLPTCVANGSPCVLVNTPDDNATNSGGTTVQLQGGTEPYSVAVDPDSSIAMALISPDDDSILNLVGVIPGTTSVTIQDSSIPAQEVTLQVIVGNESALSVSPQTISVVSEGSTTATISGGNTPYSIVTQPNTSTATAVVSDNTLTVFGASAGTTSVTLQDSFSPSNTISIPITVTAAATNGTCSVNNVLVQDANQDTCKLSGGVWVASAVSGSTSTTSLTASSQNVSVSSGGETTVVVSGGSGNYSIKTSPNMITAIASLSSNNLTISGIARGTTNVVVQDTSNPSQSISITINVN